MVLAAVDMTGWAIGFTVAAVIVAVVAVVVLTIITLASRIADMAEDATRALIQARDRTEALWQVNATNQVADDILARAKRARTELGGGDLEAPAPGDGHRHAHTPATHTRKGLGR